MNALFEIIKDKKVIANMLTADGYIYNTIDTLIDMLNNYNKCLVNSALEPELLAIRFFEGKDKDGNSIYSIFPSMSEKSRKYIKGRYSGFELTPEEDTSYEDGIIAIDEEDLLENESETDQLISINLDTSTVYLAGCFDEYYIEDYEELGIGEVENLNTCEIDMSTLYFNELEDVKKFIGDNIAGWLNTKWMTNMVIIPHGER